MGRCKDQLQRSQSSQETASQSHKTRGSGETGRTLKVPYSEYPAALIFYKMQKAGILLGAPEDLDISAAWRFSAVHDDEKAKGFEEKFGIKLTVKFRHAPVSFGRLLAKIGYGQVLWQLEPDEFRPLCLPYILGTKLNVSYILGGTFDIPPPTPELGIICVQRSLEIRLEFY